MSLRVHPTSNFAIQGNGNTEMGLEAYNANDDIFDTDYTLQAPAPPRNIYAVVSKL
jgi:hypothetical protein